MLQSPIPNLRSTMPPTRNRQNPTKSDRNSCVRAYLLSAESRSAPNNRPRPHDNRAKRQNEKDEKCPPSSSLTPQEQPKTPQTTRSSASPSIGGNDVGGWIPAYAGMTYTRRESPSPNRHANRADAEPPAVCIVLSVLGV